MAYGGFRTLSRLPILLVELTNIGALGSGGSEVRGGGKFWSVACWKGSVHGEMQNYYVK